jgi:hypothetical protein
MTKYIDISSTESFDGGIKVYIDFRIDDDEIVIQSINICVNLYGTEVDLTDEIMYYMNKPQNSKGKKKLMQSIIEIIQNDNPTDIF